MFRVKIILLSVLLSSLVLAGFGFYSLSVMNRMGIARIDREIQALGEGHLAVKPPERYWQNFEKSLRFIYGDDRSNELIVQVKDARDSILFKSPDWPVEITEQSFPDFDRTMDTNPPKPEERNRRGPPPEAYRACEGRNRGNMSQFVNPFGETIKGTCEEENGRLVLRPNPPPRADRKGQVHKGPGEKQPPPPPETDRSDWHAPRMKKTPSFATIQTPSGMWRVGIMGSDRITMIVGVDMTGFLKDVSRYRRALLGVVPVALVLLAAGGWLIIRRTLKPISLIASTAERITVRDLNQRIPLIEADKELARLVEVINGMLDRLEKSFGQAIRFSADAAHELQTPLTILQGELDDAVQHAPIGSDEQQRYSGLLEEVQRLKSIVQKLLIFARADAGRLNLQLAAVNLSNLIESAAEDVEVMAPHLQVEKDIAPGVVVKADFDLLKHIISNLTSNAMKYTGENGLIRFGLSVYDNTAYVSIANNGIPIPEKEREKIFDRFYRTDQSRNKAVSGSGLGLSLAREIAHAHGGDLRLDPDAGNMVSFTLSLPYSTI